MFKVNSENSENKKLSILRPKCPPCDVDTDLFQTAEYSLYKGLCRFLVIQMTEKNNATHDVSLCNMEWTEYMLRLHAHIDVKNWFEICDWNRVTEEHFLL